MKLFILLFFCTVAWAECPENSQCSASFAKRFSQWEKLQERPRKELVRFVKQLGLPLHSLAIKETDQHDGAYWDSACTNLKKKGILKALHFTKNLQSNKKQIYPKAWVGQKSYPIPLEQTPLGVRDDQLVFLTDFNGRYFYFTLSPKGRLSLIKKPFKAPPPKAVNCPEDKLKLPHEPFEKLICQTIWNEDSKRFELISYEWPCL